MSRLFGNVSGCRIIDLESEEYKEEEGEGEEEDADLGLEYVIQEKTKNYNFKDSFTELYNLKDPKKELIVGVTKINDNIFYFLKLYYKVMTGYNEKNIWYSTNFENILLKIRRVLKEFELSESMAKSIANDIRKKGAKLV